MLPRCLTELPELTLADGLPLGVAHHGRPRCVTIVSEKLAEGVWLEELLGVVARNHLAHVDGLVEFIETGRRAERLLVERLLYLLELVGVVDLLYFRDCLADLLVSHCNVLLSVLLCKSVF